MGIKGCWTCRERKVRCDSKSPKCGNCTKARRVCKGYGIQLSWPRDGDAKRAMISRDTTVNTGIRQSHASRFLNSSSWDVSLSEELESGRSSTRYLRTMQVPRPTYLSPTGINQEELHLLGFFNESRSLILGPTDEEALSQFILRIALSDPPNESNPVLQGVLALASLQLHGNAKSFRYKYLAVSSAVANPANWLDEKILLQNLMAMMLLYHYELSLESNSKGSWVTFLCAVKRIINTSPAMRKLVRQEYSVFLDWIYYHETLAEFTVRHWHVPYQGCGFAPVARSPRAVIEGSGTSKVENNNNHIGCPIDVLQLIVHSCRLAIPPQPSSPTPENAERELTKALEDRISSAAVGDFSHLHTQYTTTPDRTTLTTTLHRLAATLYANRAIHHVTGSEFHHRRLVREGILLLTRARTCQHAWPLFIIACEAAEDEHRLAIMQVFERSRREVRRRTSHLHFIQHLVEAVWRQRDLDVEGEVGYLRILDAVVGGVPFMPVFA